MRLAPYLLAGAAVLGAGVWIGRSSSTGVQVHEVAVKSEPVEVARPAVAARAHTSVPSRPVLRRTTSSAPGLAADLRSTDANIRRAAVAEVARSSDADPQILLAASRDPEPGIAGTAVVALGKLYADGLVPVKDMIDRATDRSMNERIRPLALNALGTVENPDAAATLVNLLASGDVGERRAASALLANQDPALAIPALIRALADADEYVRDNAHTGLKSRARGRDFGMDAGAWQAWWQSAR
jgi:hypothetical protein